jgi:hypothetical protein
MEVLNEAIAFKKTLLERIRGQMGDVTKYSKEVQSFLKLAELGITAAEMSAAGKDPKNALYHYGRCCSNLGALLALGPKEKKAWEVTENADAT